MHVSGSMKYCSSSSVEWMQSTGQTSTQLASLVPMHGSVMMYAIGVPAVRLGRFRARRPHAGLRDDDVAADARLAGQAQGAVEERRLAALLGQRLALCAADGVEVLGPLIDGAGEGRADALGAAGGGPV